MAESTWSDVEKQSAARLWAAGWTAGKIAETMPGRSRNAIIGIVHRMKLAKRPNPVRTTERTAEQKWVVALGKAPRRERVKKLALQAQPKPPATVVQFPPKPKPPVRGVARYTGGDGCQWLEGERPTWTKCGCARFIGSSWCESHYHRVFQQQAKVAE
jgi:hypothetical protein